MTSAVLRAAVHEVLKRRPLRWRYWCKNNVFYHLSNPNHEMLLPKPQKGRDRSVDWTQRWRSCCCIRVSSSRLTQQYPLAPPVWFRGVGSVLKETHRWRFALMGNTLQSCISPFLPAGGSLLFKDMNKWPIWSFCCKCDRVYNQMEVIRQTFEIGFLWGPPVPFAAKHHETIPLWYHLHTELK